MQRSALLHCAGGSPVAGDYPRVPVRACATHKGMRYPPDPPRPEEIIFVMRQAGSDRHGLRIPALIGGAVARRVADLRSADADRD